MPILKDNITVGEVVVLKWFDIVHFSNHLLQLPVHLSWFSEGILHRKIVENSFLDVAVYHFDLIITKMILLAEMHDVLEDIFRTIYLSLFVVQLPFGEVVESCRADCLHNLRNPLLKFTRGNIVIGNKGEINKNFSISGL